MVSQPRTRASLSIRARLILFSIETRREDVITFGHEFYKTNHQYHLALFLQLSRSAVEHKSKWKTCSQTHEIVVCSLFYFIFSDRSSASLLQNKPVLPPEFSSFVTLQPLLHLITLDVWTCLRFHFYPYPTLTFILLLQAQGMQEEQRF